MPQSTPAFILGSHRSGTTLLRYILDSHPNIACPPECKIMGAVDSFLNYPQTMVALRTIGVDRAHVLTHFRQMIDGILSGYARRMGKSRWIEKTPNNYRHLRLIEDMFAATAKYIVISRHPLDTIQSLEEFFAASTSHHQDPEIARVVRRHGKSRLAWARYWCAVYEEILAFAASVDGRIHVVSYEALALDTEETVAGLFQFLGEEPGGADLDKIFAMPHTKGFQDTKIFSASSIYPDSVGRWRSWPKREADLLWAKTRATAARFGYLAIDAGVPQSADATSL